MAGLLLREQPHRRYNPLDDTWVLVSPQRTKRPWRGRQESIPDKKLPAYDPECYLCPGNRRAGGRRNPNYRSTFAFDNDFAALKPRLRQDIPQDSSILKAVPERGICRVLCFSPRHDLSLAQMTQPEVRRVVEAWMREQCALARRSFIHYIQIFENKGEMMGCSNPHPHCQIWAQEGVPDCAARELVCQEQYRERTRHCLLCDYLGLELSLKERIIGQNEGFVALVPFWAVWPFETLLLSKKHHALLPELGARERENLASLMLRLTARYDNLFQISFPYSMGWHQTPAHGKEYPGAHLHAHFYPPLLRSATVRKFMVGYEMLAEPQRDLTPEAGAARLRDQPEQRFE